MEDQLVMPKIKVNRAPTTTKTLTLSSKSYRRWTSKLKLKKPNRSTPLVLPQLRTTRGKTEKMRIIEKFVEN